MDKETFLSKILEVGTLENDVERRTLLTEISDGVSEVYDNVDTLNTTITSLNANLEKTNTDLQKAQETNMNLFLRIGEQKTAQQVQQSSGSTQDEKEPEKRKFEDLFKKGDDK